ncbi:MAG: hypothetical protein LQ347_004098, partial [Umbilicaria vellea]
MNLRRLIPTSGHHCSQHVTIVFDAYSFPDVTAVAIRKHIQKLKEKAEKGDVNPAGTTSANDTTPKSSPKKGPKTLSKAAGPKVPTSAAKPSAMKGTKRNADSDANESGDSQKGAVKEEEGLKVDTMTRGKRIKLINGQFQVDDDE